LQDLYSAELQLIEALPEVAKAASDKQLKQAVEDHLEVTRGHAERVRNILEALDETDDRVSCKAMKGLIKESEEALADAKDPAVCDAAIISSAQRIEHYEIAGYGTACAYAEVLGYDDHAEMLQQTLEEEKEADQGLTDIATASVNVAAAKVKQSAATANK
jgi:ferritin-like metal-binding protein YciE